MKNSVKLLLKMAVCILVFLAACSPGQVIAAFPGLNGLIAFESNLDGRYEIYTMRLDGSDQTKLTTAGGEKPAWSPDGSMLAFASGQGGDANIYLMNADGSNLRNLTSNNFTETWPTWSPDGSQIAFGRFAQGNWDIWVTNVADGSEFNLTSNPATDVLPSWSPDGTQIAFETDRDGDREIYVTVADGSGLPRNLTNSPSTGDEDPDWSPDGSLIVFARFDESKNNQVIAVMSGDGTNQTILSVLGFFIIDSTPAWSPDGDRIVFSSQRDFNRELYVMNADGSDQTRLTNNAPPGNTDPMDWFPAWQPVPEPCSLFLSIPLVMMSATTCRLRRNSLERTRYERMPPH